MMRVPWSSAASLVHLWKTLPVHDPPWKLRLPVARFVDLAVMKIPTGVTVSQWKHSRPMPTRETIQLLDQITTPVLQFLAVTLWQQYFFIVGRDIFDCANLKHCYLGKHCQKFRQLLSVGRWIPPGTLVSSTRKLISLSSSFHRLDMSLAVAEALNPNKSN